jgi:DNA-directed RNA polymerase subunit M/transcription elongation factor TFIIS
MIPQRAGSKITLVCRKCGKKKTGSKEKKFKISAFNAEKKGKIIVVDKNCQLPKVRVQGSVLVDAADEGGRRGTDKVL